MLIKKIIIFLLIGVIELGSFPVDAYARAARPAADLDREEIRTLVTETKQTEQETVIFAGEGQGVHSIVPALADQQDSQLSAGFEETATVRKLAKQDYRPNEEIDVVIENGANKEYKAELIDAIGSKVALETQETETGAAKVITLEQPSSFRPGKYTIRITDSSGGVSEQDFSWGVLAINPDKSIYTPKETATLAIGVLDEGGDMICDAQVELQITDPSGVMTSLSTDNGKITVNEECKSHDFTLKPDYETTYQTGNVGTYKMLLKSQTKNGAYAITDSFQVKESVPFDVKRISATRIYPPNTYPVTLEITANQDFEGTISETVPASFKIARPGEEVKTDREIVDSMVASQASDSADIKAPDSLPKRPLPQFTTDAVIAYNTINTVGDFDGGKAVLGASIPPIGMPFSGMYRVTQEFGQSLVYDEYGHGLYDSFGMQGHDGIDFAMPEGTPLLAVDNGKVLLAGAGDYGTTIVIEHAWGRSYYGHLSAVAVKEGDEVPAGATIGSSGNTGLSTGPHLHFGIKPNQNESNNGYYGKVDPAYYIGMKVPASQVLGIMTSQPSSDDFSSLNSHLSSQNTDVQILNWRVSIKKGEKIKVGYNYLAPRISPQFYTLGPAVFTDLKGKEIFHEERKWQIASDALDYKFKQGTFQKLSSTDCPVICNQSITGLGFKPKAIIFEWTTATTESLNAHFNYGIGFATASSSAGLIGERSTSYCSEDNLGTSDSSARRSDNRIIMIQNTDCATGTGLTAEANMASFDADGFTIRWTINDTSARIVSYTAVGGADVSNAYTGTFTLTNSSGTQTVSEPGFQPDFLMIMGSSTTAVNTNTPSAAAAIMNFGFASSPDKEAGVSLLSDDNQGITDTCRQQSTSALILMLQDDGASANCATQDAMADLYEWDDHGFTLNKTDPPGSNTEMYYLALKGGVYDVGAFVQPTTAGTQSIYTGFRPSGIMTLAASQSASTAISAHAAFSLGGASKENGALPWCNDTSGVKCTAPGVQINAANDWCNDTTGIMCTKDWSTRKKITFNNATGSADLADFPVLVKLDATRIDYSKTQNSGQDVRFVDPTNPSQALSHEIESWNESGSSYVWVKVPQLDASSSADFVWMYYGNASASDGQDASNVWNSNFNIVYHMNETSGTALTDKAGTAQNATKLSATEPSAVTYGKIDGGQDFDGTNDYTSTTSPGLPTGDFTYSVWVNSDSDDNTVFMASDGSAGSEIRLYMTTSVTEIALDAGATNVDYTPPANTWVHMTMARTGSTTTYYKNGTPNGTRTDGDTLNFNGCELFLGTDVDSGCNASLGNYINGVMDEFRVANVGFSPSWIMASYKSENDELNTFGTEQLYSELQSTSGWSARKKITFNNAVSNDDLINFPILVTLNPGSFDYGKTQNSGQDIRFVDPSDPNTVLPHEIDTWNESGTSYVWVKVPKIDRQSTTDAIWMYYGNPNASDGQDAANVWDSSFKAVWHTKETTGANVADSTQNGNTGVLLNGAAVTSGGRIGYGNSYDGTNDLMKASASASLANLRFQNGVGGGMTVSAWIKADTSANSTWGELAMKAQDAGPTNGWLFETIGTNNAISLAHTYSTTNINRDSAGAFTDTTWAHVAMTASASAAANNIYMYANGAELTYGANSDGAGTPSNDSIYPFTSGCDVPATSGNCFDGTIDELRISNVIRSADWIEAEYRTMTDTMNTLGAEEIYGSGGTRYSQASLWGDDIDNLGTQNSSGNTMLDSTKVIRFGASPIGGTAARTVATASLESFDPTGFTLNWTEADTTTRLVLYWAAGSVNASQEDYRWYKNANSLTPGNALEDQNSQTILAKNKPYARLRTNVSTGGNGMNAATQGFKLQYASNQAESAIGGTTDWCNDTTGVSCFAPKQPGEEIQSNITDWCNDTTGVTCTSDWSARRKITFNNASASASLTDFPVLVKLDSTRIDYSKTQNSGQDIRFVDPSDPNTVLPHEIESWNESGTSYMWVKVPTIDGKSKTDSIWMYYGNASISDGQAATSVWNSNFAAVYHLKEDPTVTNCTVSKEVCDSTSNAINGDNTGLVSGSQVTGRVNGALEFTGTEEIIAPYNAALNMTNAVTISAWIRTDSVTGFHEIVAKDDVGDPNYGFQLDDNFVNFYFENGGTWYEHWSNPVLTTGKWYHVSATYDTNVARIYINGKLDSMKTRSALSMTPDVVDTEQLMIGNNPNNEWFDGIIDEVRVSNSVRSADWMLAEYLTQADEFNTYGTEITRAENQLSSSGWQYRKKIQFNNASASASLTDFPVLVKLDQSRIDYDKTQNSGQDIRFVDPADNTTVLAHEIESWNENGTSYVWVKVPSLAAGTEDSIWMYYGNPGATDGQAATSVWNSNYNAVYHLKEDPSGGAPQMQESTTNNLDATSNGSMPSSSQVTGKVDGSLSFDGSNDYLSVSDNTAFEPSTDISLSFWVYFKQTASAKGEDIALMYKDNSVAPWYSYQVIYMSSDNRLFIDWMNNSSTGFPIYTNAALAAGKWYHIEFVKSGATGKIYVNGVEDGTASPSYTGTIFNSNGEFRLGAVGGSSKRLNGLMDETRVSNSARSADWVEAEYLSTSDQMNMYGDEQAYNVSGASTTTWKDVADPWCNDTTGITCTASWAYRKRISFNNPVTHRPEGFTEGFEDGNLNGWTINTSPGSTFDLDTTTVKTGYYSGKITMVGDADSDIWAYKTIPNTTSASIEGYIYLTNVAWYDILALQTSADQSFNLHSDATGKICAWNGAYNSGAGTDYCSATSFSLNAWHKYKVEVTTSTTAGSIKVYMDDTLISDLDMTNIDTGSSSITDGIIGDGNNNRTATYYVDDINVVGTSTALTNFPVLVKLDSSRIDYGKTQSDGDDIRFVDPDNPNVVLDHEIETWDENGESFVWVKVPKLDANSTSDSIWMYYGNDAATNGEAATSVWETNYKAVWHLKEEGRGVTDEYAESTSTNDDGTGGNGNALYTPNRVKGAIGYAQNFDGVRTWISGDNTAIFSGSSAFTIEAWIKPDDCGDTSGQGNIFSKEGVLDFMICYDGATSFDIGVFSAGTGFTETYDNYVKLNNWQHVVLVFDGSSSKVYYNGVEASISSGDLDPFNVAGVPVIGNDGDSTAGTSSFDGGIDEVRISDTNRSADWIRAEYLTASDQMNTFGSEETQTSSAWRFKDNTSVDNGTQIITSVLGTSAVGPQLSYQESALTTLNQTVVAAGEKREFDFSLDGTNASNRRTYYFRLVNADGTPLTSYTRYPSIIVGVPNQKVMRGGKFFNYKTNQPFTF